MLRFGVILVAVLGLLAGCGDTSPPTDLATVDTHAAPAPPPAPPPDVQDGHRAAPTTTVPPPAPSTTTTMPPSPQVHTASVAVAAPATVGGCPGGGDPGVDACWDRLAGCESGGNWAIDTGNGYYGGLQFALSSWRAVGGTGYPNQHPRATQIDLARRLWASGGWRHWPGCSRSFGWI